MEDALSDERLAKAGVPKGSCLFPACYVWYTDDISVILQAKLLLNNILINCINCLKALMIVGWNRLEVKSLF